MCTVVFHVPDAPSDPVRLLAVRDEDPSRRWNPLGAWWEELPGVIGVQDRRAGGAWLAARPRKGRLAVVLNREGDPDVPAESIASRGTLPLDAVAGRSLAHAPRMRGFNLLTVDAGRVGVTSWDGRTMRTAMPEPGVHMLAHHDVDDPRTERISAWLDAFGEADDDDWIADWTAVLARTAETDPRDDRAIVRDNRPHGYPTMSTLACVAEVGHGAADVRYAELAVPGAWSPLEFSRP